MKYEEEPLIGQIFDEWQYGFVTSGSATIYLTDGMVIRGKLDGLSETTYDLGDGEEGSLWAGILSEIEFIEPPQDKEILSIHYGDHVRNVITGHPLWPNMVEGKWYKFNETNEPEKIVLDDGTVIWDKAANKCLRLKNIGKSFSDKRFLVHEEKIR